MPRCAALLLSTILCATAVLAQTAKPREIFNAALAARRAGNRPEYLRLMREVAPLAVAHPFVLMHLARAHALNGDASGAATAIERLASIDVTMELDGDFDAVRNDASFARATATLAHVREKRVSHGRVAFTLPQRDLLPESIAYDAARRRWLVTSIRKRAILQFSDDGTAKPFLSGLDYAPLGLAVDRTRGWIWVATSAFARMEGFRPELEGRTALLAFTRDGKPVRRIEASGFLDSVTVAGSGDVIVTSSAGTVLRVDGESLTTLVPAGVMRSPQGITAGRDRTTVYVADYAGEIRRVDIHTGDSIVVRRPDDWMMYGIDGLTYANGSLFAIQNGVEPHRVVSFRLGADGNELIAREIVEMNTAYLDEPTNGTMAKGAFHFVAASQGHRFDEPEPHDFIESVILRVDP